MKKDNNINNLMGRTGAVQTLKTKLQARREVKDAVCAVLSPALAAAIASAGLEDGELTLGVVGAAWASRLRYVTDTLRTRVSRTLSTPIERVRIRVVPAPPAAQKE